MLEIFRMQLRQMLGGKRKWLVVVCLVLPALLTLAAVNAGGYEELQREIEAERSLPNWAAGEIPATARRVTWNGADRTFADGALVLTRDALLRHGKPVHLRHVLVVNDGYLLFRDGELWLDPTKESLTRSWHFRLVHRRDSASQSGSSDVPDLDTVCAIYLFLLYPQAICLLLALFYGTSVLGEELDGKTLTYLFTRPLRRSRFVVGKYLGIVAALVPPTGLSLLASWLLLEAPGGVMLFAAVLVGTVGALLAYNALFVLFGFLIPRRAMIVALLYGVSFELILSFLPALVNEFTVTYYLRSLVVAMLDLEIPREITRMVGSASAPTAVLALAGIVVGSLMVASLLAARREYVVKDTA
jgi:ABC-type transport system involved in multi-copper enzyme maturation permease subunit